MAVKNVKWTIEKNKQNLWIHANNMSVCLMCLVGEPQSISHLIAQAGAWSQSRRDLFMSEISYNLKVRVLPSRAELEVMVPKESRT